MDKNEQFKLNNTTQKIKNFSQFLLYIKYEKAGYLVLCSLDNLPISYNLSNI